MGHRRYVVHVVLLLVVLSLVGAVIRMWQLRIDPASIPQSRLHRIGTVSGVTVMSPLPSQRRVVMDPVRPHELELLARGFLPRQLGGVAAPEITGYFDPASGEIHITGEVVRVEAMAPVPWLQRGFRHALRHEYGHAFLDEWLRDRGGPEAAARIPGVGLDERDPFTDLPAELVPLMREYRGEPERYGSPYFTSAFTEFFAESYARFLEGEPVPPSTEAFFARYSNRGG